MKILLVGHSIIDHIEELGTENSKAGGIFYSLLGISSLVNSGDEIYLLTGWNEKTFHLFAELYSKANFSFANKVDEMPEVLLKTTGENEREETYKNLSMHLSIGKISDWNQFDGVLINMITGFDISLDQLKMIRENFNGPVYFDVHTLSRGVGINMQREFCPIPNIKEWLANINILQCNNSELQTIVGNRSEFESAAEIIKMGPQIVLITLGDKGAHAYYNDGVGIKSYFINPVKINTANKIGCGDIFGAVFFYSYISNGDVYKSLTKANKAGALAASIKNIAPQTMINVND